MKSREEAWAFALRQLQDSVCIEDPGKGTITQHSPAKLKYRRKSGKAPEQFHYGKCELRELLDFIYGPFAAEEPRAQGTEGAI